MASSLVLTTTLVLLSAILPLHVFALGGFSAELIHRDSPNSPYHDPSATPFNRIRAATRRSISRANDLRHSFSSLSASSSSKDFQTRVNPENLVYLVSFSIGTPPTKQILFFDTGSGITWTQCKNCTTCSKQNGPIFDPATSSTYRKVYCNDPKFCPSDYERELGCNRNDNYSCEYIISVGPDSSTVGTISLDTVTFDSIGGKGTVSIPDVPFGCSSEVEGSLFKRTNSSGVAGFGPGHLSLISQHQPLFDNKFSYCLVPFSNTSASSLLSFGENAVVREPGTVSTELLDIPDLADHYYLVTLEDIIVGDGVTNASSSPQRARIPYTEVALDVGPALSFVTQPLVDKVEEELLAIVKLPRVTPKDEGFRLCFDATKMKSPSDIPDLTIKFTGAKLKVGPQHTFLSPEEGVLCLAILPFHGYAIDGVIGGLLQQNFHIGYDLKAWKVTFASTDCANL